MNELIAYILSHTERGECHCGLCCDAKLDAAVPPHSVNVHFFWVAAKDSPTRERLLELLRAHYPSFGRLEKGPSYIEIGAELGDQGLALLLIGLGGLVGLWQVITPEALGFDEEMAKEAAGRGFVMAGGIRSVAA